MFILGAPAAHGPWHVKGPAGSSWGPIRSRQFFYGLPGFSKVDHDKVLEGNRLMRISAAIIQACVHASVPVSLENPRSSRFFLQARENHVASNMLLSNAALEHHGVSVRMVGLGIAPFLNRLIPHFVIPKKVFASLVAFSMSSLKALIPKPIS